MAVRKIIEIDESKCDGCGQCVLACAEGAIEIRDGKARIISDDLCDGLGDCLGECPQGALIIVEREAAEFDEEAVKKHLSRGARKCPSADSMVIHPMGHTRILSQGDSELTTWPIKMQLISPRASYFENARLLLAGDCTAFTFASMHSDFIKGRVVIIGCPKFDDNDAYIDKLSDILVSNDIQEISLIHMEVPCCKNLKRLVDVAIKRTSSTVPLRSYTVRRTGEIIEDTD
ncbi:MAG: 4Fe-4S binding protein [Euryarchaeota archaeon]|nr:4Fe-4S binding protein [Euryarchaeota archaeon]